MSPELEKRIAEFCRDHKRIVAAYLFGSAAAGHLKPDSDIDLALLLDGDPSSFDLLSFICALERICNRRADVIVLNNAGEFIKYEVRRKGRLIYETDPAARKRFEILGRKRFEDYLFLHRRYAAAVLYGETHG